MARISERKQNLQFHNTKKTPNMRFKHFIVYLHADSLTKIDLSYGKMKNIGICLLCGNSWNNDNYIGRCYC